MWREQQLINNLLGQQVNGLIYILVDRHPCIAVLQVSHTSLVMLDSVDPPPADQRAAHR